MSFNLAAGLFLLCTAHMATDEKWEVQLTLDLARRGYPTESQKGLLLVEKLDYLQSKLLQNIFFSLSKPLMHQGGHSDATGCSNGRGDRGGPDASGRATCTR